MTTFCCGVYVVNYSMPGSTATHKKASIQEDRGFVFSKSLKDWYFDTSTPWTIIFNLLLSQLLILLFHLVLVIFWYSTCSHVRYRHGHTSMKMFFFRFHENSANDFRILERSDVQGSKLYTIFQPLSTHFVKGWVWKRSSACRRHLGRRYFSIIPLVTEYVDRVL